MSDKEYTALVVDDEPALRRLTAAALRRRNFRCDEAENGQQACAALANRRYDLVVTDLRMPLGNGHALAVELLSRGGERPAIVVFTGVLEPKLVEDLLARGVDDVIFKPLDFHVFGAKVRAICERYDRLRQPIAAAASSASPSADSTGRDFAPLTIDQVEKRLDSLAGELPVSPAAIEVVNLAQNSASATKDIAEAVARDPALCVEVLRLANSAAHCPSGERIEDLKQAIIRIGHHQICALALAATTHRALTATRMGWIDAELLSRRSRAAGLAIGQLHAAAAVGADDEGLLLSALLLPISRMLLALAFPELYARWIALCQQAGCSLASLERRLLPIPPSRAIAGMLARWNFSPRLFKPLQHSGQTYEELGTLTEPLRSKVERMRIAELLGTLAVGRFEACDEIEFPPPETMSRLRAEELGSIVEQVKANLCESAADHGPAFENRTEEVDYFKLAAEPYDWLELFVRSQGLRPCRISREEACRPRPLLVNCLNVSAERLRWFLDDAVPDSGRSLVCSQALPSHCESWGQAVQLPCSFAAFNDAIRLALAVVGQATQSSPQP
jgi:DNA-binding response OmpR family regulator